ncbi:LysR family transcriptional regulator [Aureimonas sp. AU22]|uniref:LysR family transcriptional regulator n=1 Tax=Aureimonas sp. AU22 TaxID=1638162 RepID=UPI000A44E1E0|nr:LysR family transcriptional regulator [Aureimonas sp. AU22]
MKRVRTTAALGTSKSNLSLTIRRQEASLGYRLLQRTSRSVAPTEAGETLLSTLSPVLETIGSTRAFASGRSWSRT